MLDGAPGSGLEGDDDAGGWRGPAAPGERAGLRDRTALRASSRRDARQVREAWRPSVSERLGKARWSLAPSAAAGALLVVAAVVVLLVLSAATSGGASVPTPTPGVAVPTRTPAPTSTSTSRWSSSASGWSASSPSGSSPAGEVVVDVVGQVGAPGLVRLPAGSRVDDAVRAAGGARPEADLRRVNLARVLVDGEQLVVPAPGEQLPSAPPVATAPRTGGTTGSGDPGGASAAAPVDLNSATLADLDALPGVGPVLAQRVLDWREEHGRFTSVEELGEVPGFGPAALARLTPLLVV